MKRQRTERNESEMEAETKMNQRASYSLLSCQFKRQTGKMINIFLADTNEEAKEELTKMTTTL